MNGLESRNRTLGELMTELRSRLGFMVQGTAAKNNDLVIKSFLQEAHEYVFGELDCPAMRKKTTIMLKSGSHLYDWHNDEEDEIIDPSRVLSIGIMGSDTTHSKLYQGITEQDQSYSSLRGCPQKYDSLDGQIELWPIPEREYALVIEYIADKARFDRQGDRPSVPDRLVFLYALATAKAHYRHPDAQASATTFTNMLSKVKNRQKENRRYFFRGESEDLGDSSALQVVTSANGYTLGRSA